MTCTEEDRGLYLAEVDRLKTDYDRVARSLCRVTEERNMLRAQLEAARAELKARRGLVVGALHAALRCSRMT